MSWTPSDADITAKQVTGDLVQGGQIWVADSDGTRMTGAPRLIVPRAAGVTSYYPAISDDDRFVVFNQSRCNGPANTPGGWGVGRVRRLQRRVGGAQRRAGDRRRGRRADPRQRR